MVSRYRPAIPTMSLGHAAAGHRLPDKLRLAKETGFEGVEIFYDCLEGYAQEMDAMSQRDKLRQAAKATGELCTQLDLHIINLQPCRNYDGIIDQAEHEEAVEEITFKMELCRLLGTDMLQVPATFRADDGVTGDEEKTVRDLQELADIGLQQTPPIRIAWEAMCWSRFAPTWQAGWNIVTKVNRPNFGTVLDSFHIAGYEYADPALEGGIRPDGPERLQRSIADLPSTVDAKKVFYVQLVDAEKLDKPLVEGQSPYYNKDQPARMSWSRNCRVFPYEKEYGGYMPHEDVSKAIFAIGFEGWVSLELFTRHMSDPNPDIPRQLAERGWKSWKTLQERLRLD